MDSPSGAGGSQGAEAGPGDEETEDPMFVIKNLDTGTQMRIDDFDRLTHIAADPDPVSQEAHPAHKKGGLMKGTKALKHWTQAQAKKAQAATKKAVTHVKEVAHELHVPQALAKHKLPFEMSPSGRAAAEAGLHGADASRPLLYVQDLLRRSTGESSNAAQEVERQKSGSLASVSIPPSSEVSISSQGSNKQHVPAAAGTSTGAAAGGVVVSPTETISQAMPSPAAPASGQALQQQAQQQSLVVAQHLPAQRLVAASAPGNSFVAVQAAAAAPSAPQPVVPAVVRLLSHKVSKRPYEAVVLAQVLEGSAGVVWVVAGSHDGAFLASAGQDCVLRVWQLTASRSKYSRSSWVYSSSSGAGADSFEGSRDTSQAGGDEAGSSSSTQQGSQQAEPAATMAPEQQQEGSRLQQVTLHEALHGSAKQQPQQEQQDLLQQQPQQQLVQPLRQQEQQQQQQQQQQAVQPPVVEFGPYYSRTPVRQYHGHTEDILDLGWSSSGSFVLSASLDKTVRLWHLSQPDCLRTFEHSDFVTSVQFHPTDAQRFVSGSLDGKIRVWSILDSSVIAMVQLHQDMVTAVAFSLTGSRVMAGTMRGRVRFYDLADGKLEYVAQVDVRNQRGQHASGKKVTSIAAVPGQPQQFLITTNDSRLRLLEGYGQVLKYKGHKNSSTQARAALSPDGAQLACGSDDGYLYMWQRSPGSATSSGGAAAADAPTSGRAGAQQRGGGSGGGGADRARSMAAAAAAQYQHLMSKNASYQAFQAHEAGQPVTAVAFVPSAVAGLPKFSVLMGQGATGPAAGGAAGAHATAAEAAIIDSGRCLVQQLLVSGGFNGSIRVHELLGGLPSARSRA